MRRRVVLGVFSLGVVVLLAACGDDDEIGSKAETRIINSLPAFPEASERDIRVDSVADPAGGDPVMEATVAEYEVPEGTDHREVIGFFDESLGEKWACWVSDTNEFLGEPKDLDDRSSSEPLILACTREDDKYTLSIVTGGLASDPPYFEVAVDEVAPKVLEFIERERNSPPPPRPPRGKAPWNEPNSPQPAPPDG